MSNFSRKITDFDLLRDVLAKNPFLNQVTRDLILRGEAFLAFRQDQATIYYKGNQLCHLRADKAYIPRIYNHYLPLTRSRTLTGFQRKEPFSLEDWRASTGQANLSFEEVLPEILDHLEKESSPEGFQASNFYHFSPLNSRESHEIILLDIEAAFSESGQKTDRIDLVFYHKVHGHLLFLEMKRLVDPRLYRKTKDKVPKVIDQLTGYKNRLEAEFQNINRQYNQVIDYYNILAGGNIPPLALDSKPLLGLLLVDFKGNDRDQEAKRRVQKMIEENHFKVYSLGNTVHASTDSTLKAIYRNLQ